jgi:hypothetical protein
MSLPTPEVDLVDPCSTIYNNTLYVYSAEAFQSLDLSEGAKWRKLQMGASVSGGVCVQVNGASAPPALYVVGGTSTDNNYQGLQRYVFGSGTWETLKPAVAVTQNRVGHNAVYLKDSSLILMYAGSQDGGANPSSQTFTISTLPPYNVLAYQSSAPPAVDPLLLQWSSEQALMVGGSATNRKVMFFSPTTYWTDIGITITQPLKYVKAVKATLISGDDGSKSLYTYDTSVSPNQVSRTVLLGANGVPIINAQPVRRHLSRSRIEHDLIDSRAADVKRDGLTIASWPSYNSSLAPTAIRADYAIAQDANGTVVIAGGNKEDVLCMFNERQNSWVNATSVLVKAQQNVLATTTMPVSTTAAASPTAISTPSSTTVQPTLTSTATPAAASGSPQSALIGAIVGSIFGVALLVLLVFLYCQRRRSRQDFVETGHQRRASGIPDEKDTMDFVDRGLSYDYHNAKSFRGHGQQASAGSFSSMAILMGKVGHGQGQKGTSLGRRKSNAGSDTSSAFNKNYKSAISKPIPQNLGHGAKYGDAANTNYLTPASAGQSNAAVPRPRPSQTARRGSTRRSSGWNRYWSGGSALNILGFGNKRNTNQSATSDNRASGSMYSDTGLPTASTTHINAPIQPQPQPPALAQPVNLQRPAQGRLSRVASNSPKIAHANDFPLKEGVTGQIERPESAASVSSYNDDDYRNTVSSGVPSSIHIEGTAWTPMGDNVNGWGGPRAAHPAVPAYSESNYSTILPRSRPAGAATTTTTNPFRTQGHSQQPSNVSDMSWLNLGADTTR